MKQAGRNLALTSNDIHSICVYVRKSHVFIDILGYLEKVFMARHEFLPHGCARTLSALGRTLAGKDRLDRLCATSRASTLNSADCPETQTPIMSSRHATLPSPSRSCTPLPILIHSLFSLSLSVSLPLATKKKG